MGFAALGAQPDPDDLLCPRFAFVALRMEEGKATITSMIDAGLPRMRVSFLWNDQYWDNMSLMRLLSGVTIWTFYDVIVWIGIRQWLGTDDHNAKQPYLVFYIIPVVAM